MGRKEDNHSFIERIPPPTKDSPSPKRKEDRATLGKAHPVGKAATPPQPEEKRKAAIIERGWLLHLPKEAHLSQRRRK